MILESLQVIADEIKQFDLLIYKNLGVSDSTLAILEHPDNWAKSELWRMIDRNKKAKEQISGSNAQMCVLSLLMHIQVGTTALSEWDTLTSRQRESDLQELLDVKKQEKQLRLKLKENSGNPIAELINCYCTKNANSELVPVVKEIRKELSVVSVRRPPLPLDDISKLDDDIGWLEAYLESLPSARLIAGTRENCTVPARGNQKQVTFFVKVMANWTEKYLGKKHYGLLAAFVHVFFTDSVTPDYDADNIKSIFKNKK